MRILRTSIVVGAALALLLALAGCSRDRTAKQVAAMNTSSIQRLSNAYAAFQNFRSGRGPANEAEFKAFIKGFDPSKLSMMGIDPGDLNTLFVSPRDGKPFKIRYRVGGGRGSVDPVVFEQEGKEGKKQVGFTGGKVEEVDDAEYHQLFAGKSGSEPAKGPPSGMVARGGRPTGPPPGAPTGPPGGPPQTH